MLEAQIVTTSITLFDVLQNFLKFLFTAFFLGVSMIFLYLGALKYILTKSPQVQEANKMIFFISLGLVFLAISYFVPNLLVNLISSLREKEPNIKPLPSDGVILRPTGTYNPIPVPRPSDDQD
jgi:pilus assembly protein TadC